MFVQRLLAVCFIVLLFLPKIVFAKEEKHFILILVSDLSFNEVEEFLKYDGPFINEAAMAAVNVRPDGTYSYLNNAVSLSSGRKGAGVLHWNSYERGELFQGERAETVLERWTGRAPQEGLIHPLFHKLKEKNTETTYKAHAGILGETLKKHGVFRYVLGHSDLGEEKIRYGSLFTMDEKGESLGELHSAVRRADDAPFGYEMEAKAILKKIGDITNRVSRSFIVVEWGDVQRLFAEKERMTPGQFAKKYEETLKKLLHFAKRAARHPDYAVMMLSPAANREAYKEKKQLAPLLFWNKKGNFYSETTKQAHIVANIDIAPTILDYFSISAPKEMAGFPLQVRSDQNLLNHANLLRDLDFIFTIFATRSFVLSSYVTLLVILLISTALLLWKKEMEKLWMTIGQTVLLAGMSSPLWFLLFSHALKYVSVNGFILLITCVSLFSGYVLVKWSSRPTVVLGSILLLAISFDLIFGAPLMQRSYLGYDPVIGARFYGIGNEYAGMYIVSALFVMVPMLEKRRRAYVRALIAAIIVLIFLAAPNLGTNAGATLSAVIAFLFLGYVLFFQERPKFWQLAVFTIFGVLSLLFLYGIQKFGTATHIGLAFDRLLSGDFVYIFDLIKRKLAMNWKIFKYSYWTELFVTSYILIGILLWKYKQKFSDDAKKLTIQTGIIASVALLLLNDSGVVAAATSMYLLVSASCYWLLAKRLKNLSA